MSDKVWQDKKNVEEEMRRFIRGERMLVCWMSQDWER